MMIHALEAVSNDELLKINEAKSEYLNFKKKYILNSETQKRVLSKLAAGLYNFFTER